MPKPKPEMDKVGNTAQGRATKWYESGLKFECTQCGNCCTGSPGYVYVTEEEIERIAAFLRRPGQGLEPHQIRRVGRDWSLTEDKKSGDCVFLERTSTGKRVCSIYPVRPMQCRTWPFWDSLLESPETWDAATWDCPGMNKGRLYDFVQIEIRRTAKDWDELPK